MLRLLGAYCSLWGVRQIASRPVSTSRYSIGVPWAQPVFALFNGQHPLPRSLLADTPEFAFIEIPPPSTPELRDAVLRDVEALRRALGALPAPVDPRSIEEFIQSRAVNSQQALYGPWDLLFLHTIPLTLGQRPWAIHIESTLTMFEPFFGHFRTRDLDLDATPAWHIVRHLVRAPQCRAIFTHIRRSHDDLPVLFRDEALARKIHHAPLGIEFEPGQIRAADEAIGRKNAKQSGDEFVFLFTNSWHQDAESFYKRGGAEALLAFVTLLERRPNCRLILRSTLPEKIEASVRAQILSHPRIEVIERTVSDEDLFALLHKADAFLLPSTHLHTISLLRAMATGAVPFVTDVIAIEEFVEDGRNGFVLPGRRGIFYQDDPRCGLARESIEPVRQPNTQIAIDLAAALERFVDDSDLRRRLRANARQCVERRHGIAGWREGFHAMLRSALGSVPSAGAM